MHRDEDTAFLEFAFVAFGFVFRDAQTNERADETTRPGADGRSAEACHQGSGGDERSKAWNSERACSHKPSKDTAQNPAGACAGGGALRSLRVFFVGEILRTPF